MSSPPSTSSPVLQEPISAAAQNIIDKMKADYDERITTLTQDFNEKLNQALSENHELHEKLEKAQLTIDHQDQLIYRVTGGGAPSYRDPCFLCGRVGRIYAEEAGERIERREPLKFGDWGPRQQRQRTSDAPQGSEQESEESRQNESHQIIGNRHKCKHLLESEGGYVFDAEESPEWYKNAHRIANAAVAREKGWADDKELERLEIPVPTDEEILGREPRRNIMTGVIKPPIAETYGDLFDRFQLYGGDETGDNAAEVDSGASASEAGGLGDPASQEITARIMASQGWTAEQVELATRPATGNNPWSEISPAWIGESGGSAVETPGESGSNSWDDGENESKNGSVEEVVVEGMHKESQ
jgi:hypothetical protein